MVKVSVIVPVYNGEKHLEECLDSICGQTLKEIEILCVDDGSTDSSYEILKRYQEKDARIHLFRQQNLYAGVARNLGKSHAVGEYLAFWDCDDFFELDALEKLYDKAKSVDADVCVCGGNRFFESTGKIYPWPAYLLMKNVPEEDPFNRYTNPDHYLDFTNVAAWNKLFKREYIEKIDLDFQNIRNGNDVYFTVNAIGLADRITVLNERLINYRVNQDSGLMCSQDKAPLAPIHTWVAAAENLEKYDGFGERAFANQALTIMIYMFEHFQSLDSFRQALSALQEYGLKKMHIFPREEGYYSPWNEQCVCHLYEDTPEEFAVFLSYSIYAQKTIANARKQELKTKNAKLASENRELRRKNVKQKKRLREMKKELVEVRRELEQTQREKKKYQTQVEMIKESWSYRAGKKIMWLPGKIRRIVE
ncbi:MAG: glycosyltransferase [Lachnospiraceae bacterium]|nr:glycosyltransferase [Lachnospiraceae bacterium]